MSDWEAFVAKMREEPGNAAVMGVAADYLEEHGDPRAEALRWLWERGCVGAPGWGYGVGSLRRYCVNTAWYGAGILPRAGSPVGALPHEYNDPVTNRLWLLDAYAAADEATRREYLGYTTSESP